MNKSHITYSSKLYDIQNFLHNLKLFFNADFSLCIMIFQVLIYTLELQQFGSCNKSFSYMLIVSPVNLWCNSGSIFELILYITLLNVKALEREHGVQQCASNNEQCGNQSETAEAWAASPCLVQSPVGLKSQYMVQQHLHSAYLQTKVSKRKLLHLFKGDLFCDHVWSNI